MKKTLNIKIDSKEVTNFNILGDIPVNPVITALLKQFTNIRRILKDVCEEYDGTWKLIDEVCLFPAIIDESLKYLNEEKEELTYEELDAANDLIQLMLDNILDLQITSAILSNMEHWTIEHLNTWLRKKNTQYVEDEL
jgi:hypothetical protein